MPNSLPNLASLADMDILIVEDSSTQALNLKYLLEQNGYQVSTAANGRLALEHLERHKPHIVISDIVMPEMDGYALCRAIKTDKALENIPVILVTSLTDLHGILKGLECGADNFIRKPYDEKYLLSRIDYLLMNRALRKTEKVRMGIEIYLLGKRHFLTIEHQQIIDLLISVYEEAVHMNEELETRRKELTYSNQTLAGLYRIADGLNHAVSAQEVIDKSVERTTELPGIRDCWIALCEGDGGLRLAGARHLPSALISPCALKGDCLCRRQLLSGKLNTSINLRDCELIKHLQQHTGLTGQHICIPIAMTNRPLGIMILLHEEEQPLKNGELQTLLGIGNQIAMALMRAQMHEQLEQRVQQRTAALKASESALKEAQRLAGLGGWTWDIRNGEHLWSEETYRILGHDPILPPTPYPEVQQYFTPDSWMPFAAAVEKALAEGIPYECDAEVVRPDGARRWIVVRGEATRDGDTQNVIKLHGTVQDITERKIANERLKDAFNEKEMLLKEVYHRVKNNLQVVSSLINLQAKNVKNEATLDLLTQSADRIKAMALLHEKLYQSKDLARIDFNAYIHSLVDHLLFGFGAHSDKIKVSMRVDAVFLDVDTAIPCGLIINELLSNALKHAFPDNRKGKIDITFTQDQDEFILMIADNGIGFPIIDRDFKKSSSLGLQLVATLANQLMGQVALNQTKGSAFSIRFTNTLNK